MALKMIRQPSLTPNITNIDDFIVVHHAYGGHNGIVKDKGLECSYTIDGSKFKINAGRITLYGVESDVDASGVTFTIDNISTKRFYVIYYEVNLAEQTTKMNIVYDTADYPVVDPGDNLISQITGVARLPLYSFTAQNGVISTISRRADLIDFIVDYAMSAQISAVSEESNSLIEDGKIGTRKVTDIFEGATPKVKNAVNADEAVLAISANRVKGKRVYLKRYYPIGSEGDSNSSYVLDPTYENTASLDDIVYAPLVYMQLDNPSFGNLVSHGYGSSLSDVSLRPKSLDFYTTSMSVQSESKTDASGQTTRIKYLSITRVRTHLQPGMLQMQDQYSIDTSKLLQMYGEKIDESRLVMLILS